MASQDKIKVNRSPMGAPKVAVWCAPPPPWYPLNTWMLNKELFYGVADTSLGDSVAISTRYSAEPSKPLSCVPVHLSQTSSPRVYAVISSVHLQFHAKVRPQSFVLVLRQVGDKMAEPSEPSEPLSSASSMHVQCSTYYRYVVNINQLVCGLIQWSMDVSQQCLPDIYPLQVSSGAVVALLKGI